MDFSTKSVFAAFSLILIGVSWNSFADQLGDDFLIHGFYDFLSSESSVKSEENLRESTETTILHVTSDVTTGYSDLKLLLDSDGKIESIRQYTQNGLKLEISLSSLDAGVVLERQSDKDVVKIQGKISPDAGGAIDLIYLSNGIFNSYDKFNMELVRRGDHWTLQTNDPGGRREFRFMELQGKTFFGKVIGIGKVIVN